jgi:2-haloacid dehalogenase
MPPFDLARFELLSFDCYGTLIDWETGILRALRPLLESRSLASGDEALLARYAEAEAAEERGPYRPYRDVLAATLARIAAGFGIALAIGERSTLADSLPDWPPFADTVEALRVLSGHHRLAVISNIDDDLFSRTRARLERGFRFGDVITAASVGAYKPSPLMFEAAAERLGVPKDRWLHVAESRYHDIAPATAFGLTTVHIDRRAGKAAGGATVPSAARPSLTLSGLAALARLAG